MGGNGMSRADAFFDAVRFAKAGVAPEAPGPRATVDLEADLRRLNSLHGTGINRRELEVVRIEAADRLAELDRQVNVTLDAELTAYEQEARRVHDLRPPCLKCRGTMRTTDGALNQTTGRVCPDCVDGKVSLEQLVETWRAVWDDGILVSSGLWRNRGVAILQGAEELAAHLRSVKP